MTVKNEGLTMSQLAEINAALHVEIADLQEQVNALAVENAELKKGFEKPQAYLSWHTIPPTWSDPGGGGEYLAVHDGPGHKNDDGSECWPVFPNPELETPATDTILREIKAQGLDEAATEIDNWVGCDLLANEIRSKAEKLRNGEQGGDHV